MWVTVRFYSFFKDLAGCAETRQTVPPGATLGDLLTVLAVRFPKLAAMEKSTLTAIGLEYRDRGWALQEGDEVSLFPPVQGG